MAGAIAYPAMSSPEFRDIGEAGADAYRRATSSVLDRVASHDVRTVPKLRVLVTIPVHNEAKRLEASLRALHDAFRRSPFEFRLSVAEDGSTDGTKEMLRRLPSRWPGILIREEPDSLGRGRALRQLWSTTSADIYCFTDADLAAGAGALVDLVGRVATGSPIAIGSRYVIGASTIRPPIRSLVSRSYNWMLRCSFAESIQDHQCGLKAFSSGALRELLPLTEEDSWFWDTEILILALERGIPVAELPVTWVERKSGRTHFRRLFSDLVIHGTGLLRLKSRVDRALIRAFRPRPIPAAPASLTGSSVTSSRSADSRPSSGASYPAGGGRPFTAGAGASEARFPLHARPDGGDVKR